VAAWTAQDAAHLQQLAPFNLQVTPYAVLHLYPKFAYKTWHASGWVEVAQWLQEHGLRVVLSGGPDADEIAYIQQVQAQMPLEVINLAGCLSLSENACLLHHAQAYVGPDTAMTHIAAAVGVPLVALYGPSNPVKWGPWPQGFSSAQNPYQLRGSQSQGKVILLQGPGDCVPCMEEGCERHVNSLSACLQNLPAQQVIDALQQLMERN